MNIAGGMPPAFRNHRAPTAWGTPAEAAASSLDAPAAIATQNSLRSSRTATGGRPGDGKGLRPDRSDRRFRLFIATSSIQALRRPLESAQYAAEPYRQVLERHGITQSMSRKGNRLDNAPMESFFASLKTEHVHPARFRTREEAKAAVFDYIEIFYNRQRLHSALGYRTPAEARASMEGITMPEAA
jgi:putative transposase